MKLSRKDIERAINEGLNELFGRKKEISREATHQVLSSVCKSIIDDAIYLMTIDEELKFKEEQVLCVFGDLSEFVNILKDRGYEGRHGDIKEKVKELHNDGFRDKEILKELVKHREYIIEFNGISEVVNKILIEEGLK